MTCAFTPYTRSPDGMTFFFNDYHTPHTPIPGKPTIFELKLILFGDDNRAF